jgi:hypothetical protein
MSILGNDLLLGSGDEGYNLTRSLRFRSSASAYLSRTPASAGNRSTWTFSAWMKLGTFIADNQFIFCANSGAPYCGIYLNSSNALTLTLDAGTANTTITTSAVFRDPAAWYHVVVYLDTTQATAANRWAIYVNNVLQPVATVATPAQNSTWNINNTVIHTISTKYASGSSQPRDGYLTEVNFIDGQALTPSSFGSTNTLTGVWQPARYTGTYGTNGFYLPFTDNSGATATTIGKDFSGNGNNWTPNNISVTAGVTYDSMTDVPTLTSATASNFAVLNPISNNIAYSITNGNLSISNGGTAKGTKPASFFLTSGKWYWEVVGNGYAGAVCGVNGTAFTGSVSSTGSNAIGYWEGGIVYWDGGNSGTGASYTTSDIIGIALDMSAGTVAFYKNNTLQYTATFGSGTVPNLSSGCFPCYNDGAGAASKSADFNFGQRPFTYTPPTGFVALNTFNLPTSTIVKGNTVMDATLYTGNGSTQTITNAAGFKPDLVWAKSRSGTNWNNLYDSVRGVNKALYSNDTFQEFTDTNLLTSFNSNGFSIGNSAVLNTNGATLVGWQWQAGQGSSSSNTNGSITSTVSVNASAGFSVVTYTGTGANATVGHGLGVAPSLVIAKGRGTQVATSDWATYHASLGNTQRIWLNLTNAAGTNSTYWNNTSPTSTTFSLGSEGTVNGLLATYVAYCWTPIAGYSSFGSYSGNGSTDGPMVYTGFLPRWVMVKRTDSTGNWDLYDTARSPYNAMDLELFPNSSSAEYDGDRYFDFLSNGFKPRTTVSDINASGATYIYVAFATTPFKNSLAR